MATLVEKKTTTQYTIKMNCDELHVMLSVVRNYLHLHLRKDGLLDEEVEYAKDVEALRTQLESLF